jgi:tRNA-specific 2-thiouridylase
VRVLVGMSGGVDSSVAAALLRDDGHEVVGVTLKLWGGAQDSGCCSVGDVDDARRVAQQLDIAHHVFNFSESFDEHVVQPYVSAHTEGLTPNPCIECNRHIKFDRLMVRAVQLGFDAVATGHHANVTRAGGRWQLRRGADRGKDQSYVLHMLDQAALGRTLLPIGSLTKADVRRIATERGLRTAAKHDSQDTCFITASGGRAAFLGARIALKPATVVDTNGEVVGAGPPAELVTIGQRRHLGGRYAVDVDPGRGVVTVGTLGELLGKSVRVVKPSWVDGAVPSPRNVETQHSAHGPLHRGWWDGDAVQFDEPVRRVAPGQFVVLYDGDSVLGGGQAAPLRLG